MKYRRYVVNFEGLEKRLGILGEIHLYTSEESKIAESLVDKYDHFGIEGSEKPSLYFSVLRMLILPEIYAHSVVGRSPNNADLESLAKSKNKSVTMLEPEIEKTFSLLQKIALFTYVAISFVSAPFTYLELKKNRKLQKKNNWISRLSNFSIYSNIETRNKIMAQNSIAILRKVDNLLIVCGEDHFEGLERQLRNIIDNSNRAWV